MSKMIRNFSSLQDYISIALSEVAVHLTCWRAFGPKNLLAAFFSSQLFDFHDHGQGWLNPRHPTSDSGFSAVIRSLPLRQELK